MPGGTCWCRACCCCSPRSRSTCSATASGTRWTRAATRCSPRPESRGGRMFRFIIRRLLLGLLTLWLVSTTVFVMAYWVPNDPARAIAGSRATQDVINKIHHDLGLDRPLIVQYGDYMG